MRGNYGDRVHALGTSPRRPPVSMPDRERLARVFLALEFAVLNASPNERPMFSAALRSLTMCGRSLDALGSPPPSLTALLPWESSADAR